MKDEEIDDALHTLREALAVEPSADFEERVRARLAARRPPGRGVRAWLLAAAAVVLLALALGGRPSRPAAPAPLVRSTPLPAIAPTATGAADTRTARAASSRPRRTEPARPLVPPGGMARVVRYVAAVRAQPLGRGALTRDPGAPLAEPDALVMPDIQITPLEISEGSFE